MPKRRGGPLEDRLRRAVTLFTQRRGTAVRLARKIERPASWLNAYKADTTHAGLDDSVALMRAIGWRAEDVLSADPIDEEALTLLAQIQALDQRQRDLAREFVAKIAGGAAIVVVEAPQSRERRTADRPRVIRRVADRR